jgi:hypothetical protein
MTQQEFEACLNQWYMGGRQGGSAAVMPTYTTTPTFATTYIFPANAVRKDLLIINRGSNPVEVFLDGNPTPTAGHGILLAGGSATSPGGSFEMGYAYGNLSIGAVTLLAPSGSTYCVIVEEV